MQSQSDQTKIAAEKKVTITSTHASTHASAKGHLLATAQGAYIKLEGGNIEVHAPGEVKFKASQKNFTGPKGSSVNESLAPVKPLKGCELAMEEAAATGAGGVKLGR